ncbi:MAG: ABC transporter ATP-binding protein [Paenibacillus dendritiformis]|uniref:ABC transporter ATP-binding protein n=1 Tax=Paenibacillus dendritiformis TaxID=130049 RepID=UPI00143DB7F4|nr:ABC transporter ATP-binding protein [Paenibacillus dendritiformis]MDU5141688.1 ABC transporter ATP-binding protein [Paenibacillus dendritiformis]NKI21663.1 ABC transporter ATP-binding protein [Paenibacillus dendritiformis]NRF97953.1 ABC transporter ATP-binding protein [Paenibacillus dendritiformis]
MNGTGSARAGDIVLATDGLTIAFGGHAAVRDVSLNIERYRFKSIIGPNGAGKTTLFNLLSGQLRPTAGTIRFNGQDITGLPPFRRTRLGMGRSFQMTNVFPNLTVLENVRLSVQSRQGVRLNWHASKRAFRRFEEEAQHWLDMALLGSRSGAQASYLAHGEKRKLELAMLLALQPELLLLDEPTAGISIEEVPAILEVIRRMKDEGKRTIVLIEHKMEMVLALSDTIAVLFGGRLLADGRPEEIMGNETVQAAYLGGLYDDAAASARN